MSVSVWSALQGGEKLSRKRILTACGVLLVLAAALVSQAAAQTAARQNRITQAASGTTVTLTGSVHPAVKRLTDVGPVNLNMRLESMSLRIGPSAAEQKDMDALLAAQQDPKSAQYRHGLTQEEYGARYGLTDADLKAIQGWLASQGFTVTSVAPSRNLIMFSGTAAQAEQAFHTQLRQYEQSGKTQFANATELKIPAAFSGVVLHVGGLNSFRPKPNMKRARPDFTSSVSGDHFLAPGDWATIYNVNAIYNAGYKGQGMHVGIAGQTYFPEADITNFRAAAGLSTPNLNMVCISTVSSSVACTGTAAESISDVGEADLDVEWSGAIAKDATVDFIYASAEDPNLGVFDALAYGITTYQVGGAVVPVLSMSYGDCEYDTTTYLSYRESFDTYLKQAATQMQTILVSSGDDGAGCTISPADQVATNGASVAWPASSPYVTAVGGTTFSGDGTSTGEDLPYWTYSSTADIITSAQEYIPETSWNDTAADEAYASGTSDPTDWTLASGGGGVSTIYGAQSWQWPPTNYSGTKMRFLPDVAFSASADHDGYLICTQEFTSTTNPADTSGSSCTSGSFRDSGGYLTPIGGTSASSPSFAGMLTLIVQRYGSLGQFNPQLYTLAGGTSYTNVSGVYNDVTTGDNKQACTAGTAGCVSGVVGYSATTGYDLVTGLGSVNGGNLYTALGTSITGASSYTLVPNETAISIADSGTGPITFTLSSTTYTGAVALTATSSSSLVGASLSVPSVNVTANGTAQTVTLTISPAATAANHAPALPWKTGGMVMFGVLLAPFTVRRKRVLAVLLTGLAISTLGFMMACGGGGGGSSTPSTRTYKVTVSATGTSTVNPSPVVITVTVP